MVTFVTIAVALMCTAFIVPASAEQCPNGCTCADYRAKSCCGFMPLAESSGQDPLFEGIYNATDNTCRGTGVGGGWAMCDPEVRVAQCPTCQNCRDCVLHMGGCCVGDVEGQFTKGSMTKCKLNGRFHRCSDENVYCPMMMGPGRGNKW